MKKLLTLFLVVAMAYSCADTTISEDETDEYADTTLVAVEDAAPVEYDTVSTIRHILIGLQSQATGEARTMEQCVVLGDEMIAKIQAGEPWENFIQTSDDVASIETGGVYAEFKRGMMVPEFDAYSFTAPLNTLAGIQTQFGVHVMEVLERKTIVRRKEYKFGPATYYAGDSVATVRHILVGHGDLGNRTVEAAKTKADSIVDLLASGESFDQLVVACSDDQGSVQTKGVYDSFPKGLMVPTFEKYAFTAPYNVIGVVETPYGFHVMEVISRKIME
ncbi:MAG: hypothetical protein ACI9J3_000866 [Parvicellaceae bacterium]|jgi:hypothetical protein